jgi:hypothetical protein
MVVSAVAWPTTVLVSAVLLRRQLSELLTALHARIKEGAGFKVGVLELPPVPQNAPVISLGEFPFENIDADSNWERLKYSRYGETRSIQLVHRLYKSSRDTKSFDIENVHYTSLNRKHARIFRGFEQCGKNLLLPWPCVGK